MLQTFLILGSIYFLVKIIEALKFMFTKQESSSALGLIGGLIPLILNATQPKFVEVMKEMKNKK